MTKKDLQLLINDLQNNDFEIYTIKEVKEFEDDAEFDDCLNDNSICLYNEYLARCWYFKSLKSMYKYFKVLNLKVELSKAYTTLL